VPPKGYKREKDEVQDVETVEEESLTVEEPTIPTLHEAFHCLAEAVKGVLDPDEFYPEIFHVTEAQKRYMDGNHVLGWKQVITTLEGVIGVPIR
jgi:hypothetical protein